MPRIELSVPVAAPTLRVWQGLTSWSQQGEWMLGTRVWVASGSGTSVGDELAAFTGIWRLGFLDTMTITKWDPPHVCEVLHTGRVVRGGGSFEVRALETGSELVWVEDLDLPWGPVGRLGYALMAPSFKWAVGKSLQRFARWVELGPGLN